MKDRETYNETRAISNYEKMLLWAIENDVKKEDLAVACKIFLVVYEHSNEARCHYKSSIDLLSADYLY